MVPGMNAILPAPNSVKGNTTKAVECFNSPIIDITEMCIRDSVNGIVGKAFVFHA